VGIDIADNSAAPSSKKRLQSKGAENRPRPIFVPDRTKGEMNGRAIESRRMKFAVSSPILSIVRPCFGQNCTECLGVTYNATALFASFPVIACRRTYRLSPWGEVPSAFLICPTAKVCDGKGKVWQC
jgi:hypothetical protein